jgi:hypothetical protein
MAKAMTKKENGAMTFSDERPDYMADSGRGQEGVGIEDMTIPRIDVIQDLSPQRKRNEPEYIEGAEEGMLFNSVTSELYGEDLFFVPVFFRKEWVIFKDRKKGGGFRGAFATEVEANSAMHELEDGDDCEVVDTAQHFGLVIKSDGSVEQAVISMSKSKMKVSRKWNSIIKIAGGDRFSRVYRISGVGDKNSVGESFFNLAVKQLGYTPEEVYHQAEAFYDVVKSGAADVNRGEPAASSTGTPEEEDM